MKSHQKAPKRGEPDQTGVSRRKFLLMSTMGTLTAGFAAGSAGKVFAEALSADQGAAMLQLVQDIFPHPQLLPLSVYRKVLDGLLSEAETTEETATMFQEGLAELDAKSMELHGVAYVDVNEYVIREGLLRIIQDSGFFQTLRWATWGGIYNNPDVWPLFGYEGSSWEEGGYIDRGFSDATWIPEGPTLEERLKAVGR